MDDEETISLFFFLKKIALFVISFLFSVGTNFFIKKKKIAESYVTIVLTSTNLFN